MQTKSLLLIDEICKEKGIEVNKLSFGWIRELKKDGKVRYIVRNSFGLNTVSVAEILNDKYATYEVLSSNGLSVLKHYMIFNPNIEGREEYSGDIQNQIKEIFRQIESRKVVVKANSSSEGKEVYIAYSEEEAFEIVQNIFDRHFTSLSICPFEEIECEYRVVCLDGEVLYAYKKIAENWKHNLANGAKVETNLDGDVVLDKVKDLALKSVKVTNSRFVTVDISKRKNGEIFVMEINGSVCMSKFMELAENGREIAKDIYSKAIDKMFD